MSGRKWLIIIMICAIASFGLVACSKSGGSSKKAPTVTVVPDNGTTTGTTTTGNNNTDTGTSTSNNDNVIPERRGIPALRAVLLMSSLILSRIPSRR